MNNTLQIKKKNSWLEWIHQTGYGLPSMMDNLAILLALVFVNNIFRLSPQPSSSLYYAMVIGLNFLLLSSGLRQPAGVSVGMWGFWFLMWFSILVNSVEPFFKAPQRTIAFFLVLSVVAPWFRNKLLNLVRERILDVMNVMIIGMAMLSFLGIVFHFLPSDNNGFYLGCTWHSMELSAIMGISILISMNGILNSKSDYWWRRIYIACFAGSFLVLFLAASRTALASCFIAILAYWSMGVSQNVGKIIKPALLICLMIYGISIVFPNMFHGLAKKNMEGSSQVTIESLTKSRTTAWGNRIQEIKESPIFGTGAHTVRYGLFDMDGQIEPGNAWLYIFSSMGVFQFLLFCGMIYHAFQRCRAHARPGTRASLLMSLLVYFCFVMVGEAHITAAGDFTCVYFWLLLAVTSCHDFTKDEIPAQAIK